MTVNRCWPYPPTEPPASPAIRFRRGCSFHQALRNSPDPRARLLIALAPLPRPLQNTTLPQHRTAHASERSPTAITTPPQNQRPHPTFPQHRTAHASKRTRTAITTPPQNQPPRPTHPPPPH